MHNVWHEVSIGPRVECEVFVDIRRSDLKICARVAIGRLRCGERVEEDDQPALSGQMQGGGDKVIRYVSTASSSREATTATGFLCRIKGR
jgi:hypothetical protein